MKKLYKEFFRAVGIGLVIFIVMLFVEMAQGVAFTWNRQLLIKFLFVMLYTVTLYTANSLIFNFFDRQYERVIMNAKRIVFGFLTSFSVSLGIMVLLRIFEDVVIEGESIREFIATESPSDYYASAIITLIITIIVHAFYFYKRHQEKRVKEQKIIAGAASAQFESLKNQIDPHFLFNSLNVLSSLIEENPDNAQRFTTSLSKIYRYVLEQKDKELVSVQEELSFARTYMNLLKMRFENSVFYEVQDIANPEAKVVPLSLQLLLENTIKHNVVSPQRPLKIRIFEENGYLVVENDLQKKEVLQDRRGVGLQNIVSRYAIITSRKVQVEETEKHFRVRLPILTKQVVIMDTPVSQKENNYFKAQKKVEEIKAFYGHMASYVVVNTGLAVLNIVTSPEHLWFLYPALGWGIGLVLHGCKTFDYMPFLSNEWEERKLKELMDKDKSNRWQ